MTMDEVLQYPTNLADQYASALKSIEGSSSKLVEVYGERMKAFSAAAELIRAGGWRPIAEFSDEDEYLTGGQWDEGKWYEYSGKLYWLLANRCTHARLSPEPPAREVENG